VRHVGVGAYGDELLQQARTTCEDLGGAWAPCPSAALAGTCRESAGDEPLLTVRYYTGFVCSPAEGEARCSAAADAESEGTWTDLE